MYPLRPVAPCFEVSEWEAKGRIACVPMGKVTVAPLLRLTVDIHVKFKHCIVTFAWTVI